jgi:glutaredoxin 3
MPEVVVYLTPYCPYCVRAEALLERKGVTYHAIDVGNNPALWAEMEAKSRRNTVPQIFIDDYHVGGFDDMAALDAEGRLDPLLGITRGT